MKILDEYLRDLMAVAERGRFVPKLYDDGLLFFRGPDFPVGLTRLTPTLPDGSGEPMHPLYLHPDPFHPIEVFLATRGYLGAGVTVMGYDRRTALARAPESLCRLAAKLQPWWSYEAWRLLDLLTYPVGLNADPRTPEVRLLCVRVWEALVPRHKTWGTTRMPYGQYPGSFQALHEIIGPKPLAEILA